MHTYPHHAPETNTYDLTAFARRARAAMAANSQADAPARTQAIRAAADQIDECRAELLTANRQDYDNAQAKGVKPAFLDRLALDEVRIDGMIQALRDIADQPDPVGEVLAQWTRPNGLRIERRAVPLGVIGVIFESRPNVAADASALCLRAGNGVILRTGSDSFASVTCITQAIRAGIRDAGLDPDAVVMIPTRDRQAVSDMVRATDEIDLIVPRGGRSLIERISAEARVPLLKHLEGLCHVYVDASADPAQAARIVLNAKMRRVSTCGAAETILIDRAALPELVAAIVPPLLEAGCEVRADEPIAAIVDKAKPASQADWQTEYLDAIVAVRGVDGVDGAIAHIDRYGSQHTDAILAQDAAAIDAFTKKVDSAIVLVNASTQFADGGEFGMGGEIGIATGRLHARGPVGSAQLVTHKYVVIGDGHIRP
ncbi:MAG: glutamate-5-semialdehyde dehydrogenase [Pseudomonadota bacterium]